MFQWSSNSQGWKLVFTCSPRRENPLGKCKSYMRIAPQIGKRNLHFCSSYFDEKILPLLHYKLSNNAGTVTWIHTCNPSKWHHWSKMKWCYPLSLLGIGEVSECSQAWESVLWGPLALLASTAVLSNCCFQSCTHNNVNAQLISLTISRYSICIDL